MEKVEPLCTGMSHVTVPRFWSRWWSKRTWSSSPTLNISKMHLYVERFSLKTNWRLPDELLYNEGFKKDEGNKSNQFGNCAPGTGLRGKQITREWGQPPWGASSSNRILDTPVLGSSVEETSLLGWLEDLGLTEGLWGSQTLLIGSTHIDLPLRQGGERSSLKAVEFLETSPQHTLAQDGQKFWPHSTSQSRTGSGAAMKREKIWLWHRCDSVPGLSINGEAVPLLLKTTQTVQ